MACPYRYTEAVEASIMVYSLFHFSDKYAFNRAALLNVGFLEAIKDREFDCFAFHDIDLLSEDDRHLYHCSLMPRLLNVADSKNHYKYIQNYSFQQYKIQTLSNNMHNFYELSSFY